MDFLGKDVTLGSSSAAEASPGGPRAEEWGLCWLYPQQWTQQVLPPRETWTVLTVAQHGQQLSGTTLWIRNSGRAQVNILTFPASTGLEGPLSRFLPCSVNTPWLLPLSTGNLNFNISLHCTMILVGIIAYLT